MIHRETAMLVWGQFTTLVVVCSVGGSVWGSLFPMQGDRTVRDTLSLHSHREGSRKFNHGVPRCTVHHPKKLWLCRGLFCTKIFFFFTCISFFYTDFIWWQGNNNKKTYCFIKDKIKVRTYRKYYMFMSMDPARVF